jgi:cytochrome P450
MHALEIIRPDDVTADSLESDPHPVLAGLRARSPVVFVPALGAWLVTSREHALAVMRDDETFTVDDPRFSTGRVVGPSMLTRDGAEHTRQRAPFAQPFRLAATREQLGAVVEQEARARADALARAGGGDLRLELAAPLAARVMLVALGLGAVSEQTVLGWYAEIVAAVSGLGVGREPPPEAAVAVAALAAEITAASRPDAPPSLVRDASGHAADVSAAELASNAAVLLFGGIETTEAQIATLLLQLLRDPEQLALARLRPELHANAVEESFRHEPAAASIDRYATRDVELAGAAIRRGDLVTVSLTGANRDPATFADPDRFAIERPNAKLHVALAQGPHVCLGMHLARLELRASLERLPGLRLDPAHPARIRGLVFRKPETLRVLVG